MRKLILQFIIAGCVFPATIKSQTLNHRWLIETTIGNANLGENNTTFGSEGSSAAIRNKYFSLRVNPTFGYFLIKNFAVGGTASFYYNTSKSHVYDDKGSLTGETNGNTSSLNLSPFIRYYFGKDSKTRFYIQANGTYGIMLHYKYVSKSYDNGTVEGTGSSAIPKDKIYGYGGSVGLNRFLNESVALNVNVGYNYMKDDSHSVSEYNSTYSSGKSESRSIYQSNSITWNLGLTYFPVLKKKNSENKTTN
jgi:outer membrane protein W